MSINKPDITRRRFLKQNKEAFTFHHKTSGVAMSMTEDNKGVIWAATYPGSGLVSNDPASQQFSDYCFMHKENWPQYQRSIATDDTGWVYFSVGYTMSQIVCASHLWSFRLS